MYVIGIQHDIVWEDPAANFAALRRDIERAVAGGADLIVLSEMFSYGFSMGAASLAEPADGPSTSFLVAEATKHGVTICGSIPTVSTADGLPTNQLVVADSTGVIGRYDKIHPFTFADEHHHYAPGSQFLQLVIDGIRCSFFICYDLRFGDEFWQLGPDTDLFVVVANWPTPRRHHWSTLLTARAIENQCYVLGVNRVGDDANGHNYSGDSALVDPLGVTISGAQKVAGHVAGEVLGSAVSSTRSQFPFLPDRR